MFSYIRREDNRVAHTFAHINRDYSGMRVWIEQVPNEALSLLLSDLVHNSYEWLRYAGFLIYKKK